jgi:hypothetical protein
MKSFVNSFDLFAALDQELTDNRKGVLFHLTLEFYEWYRAKELNAQWSTLGDAVRDFIGFSEELHLEIPPSAISATTMWPMVSQGTKSSARQDVHLKLFTHTQVPGTNWDSRTSNSMGGKIGAKTRLSELPQRSTRKQKDVGVLAW